jgi:phosphoglycerate dehydrogenase-like enzyme
MAEPVNVLSLVPIPEELQRAIEAVDPAVRLTVAAGWFDGEIRETWPERTARSYVRTGSEGHGSRAERDALLGESHVVVGGFPVPVDLRARAPQLRWFHQTPAGASNLRRCDLWGSDVIVTTSRGLGNTAAMAEYVVAAFLLFARGLHQAWSDRAAGTFDRSAYRPVEVAGKTACVVGAGGIGQEVARRCAALGMRVVGTRRAPGGGLPDGFAELGGPDRLHELLGRSTFVAVCCQLTPETRGLLGHEALAALPDDAVVVNVARGEVIDEPALVDALAAGRLRGVALDVYVGEFDRLPPPELWSDPRVVVTPHVSAGSDAWSRRPLQLFVENLRALLEGRPLQNLIDWSRGY